MKQIITNLSFLTLEKRTKQERFALNLFNILSVSQSAGRAGMIRGITDTAATVTIVTSSPTISWL